MTDLKIERITQAKKTVPLARIFYTGSSRGAANPDADNERDGLRRWLYVSYCPRSIHQVLASRSRFSMKYSGYPVFNT